MRAPRPARWVIALGLAAVVAMVATLVVGAAPATHEAFPGRNGLVAFVSDRDGDKNIYTVDPDTLALTRLTGDPAEDTTPAWSPDGDRIAFASNRSGRYEIWIMDADGSDPAQVTSGPHDKGMPDWSPDGNRLVYVSLPALGGDPDLWVVGADGSDPHPLVTGPDDDQQPAWSPDGDRIAFTRARTGPAGTAVALVAAEGGTVTTITDPAWFAMAPSWSGHSVVYVAMSTDPAIGGQLRVVDETGRHDAVVATFAPGEVAARPAWSPDGTLVAYELRRPGNSDLHVLPFAGGPGVPLVAEASDDTDPDWQPVPDPAA